MITIRRLLVREFLIIGSLAVALLLGARGIAELWILRDQATQHADSGLRLLVDGIHHQTQDAEELGDAVALMWRRGELAPDKPGSELALEGLLRQSQAQSIFLADVHGHALSPQHLADGYSTHSIVLVDGVSRILSRHWDEDGRVTDSRILDYTIPDLAERPWYRQAMSGGGASWTEPYRFISPPLAAVTYCRRVADAQGRTLGAVGVNLPLASLGRVTRDYKPTPHSFTWLTGPDGQPFTGTSQETGGQASGDPIFQAALSAQGASEGWPVARAGGQFWLVHHHRVEDTGWRLMVAIPVSDLISRPRRVTLMALILAALTLSVIALRLASVSRRIAKPLAELEKSSGALLAGQAVLLPPTDIRELSQARDALMAASFALQERHHLELELQRVQRLDLVGTMAAGLAHDMNNHLSAILGQIQLAALKAPEGPQAPHIAQAEAACLDMARLLQDLVAFGKPRELHSDRVDLNAVVGLAGKLLEHSRMKRMRVELDLDPVSPMVAGDRIQLEQVVLNLGFNAKDATPEGGLLALRTGCKDGEAFFEVRDTGTGMTPEVKEKLFTPFFSTKGEEKGSGLGLAMVASIVKAHKGRILVESEPGFGSAFTVWLPLAKGPV